MTFGLHRRINASKAHFDYIKVQIPIKNAVDCQILFDIRDFAKQNRIAKYYIISKDSDFDQAVKSFASNKIKVQKAEDMQIDREKCHYTQYLCYKGKSFGRQGWKRNANKVFFESEFQRKRICR